MIGQAKYDGVLYDIPDATTAIAEIALRDPEVEFEEGVLIPPGTTPRNDLECNLPGNDVEFVTIDGLLVVIVDGTQYLP